jgi:hypothetical protein
MTKDRDWPYGRLADRGVRPWFLSATGYLMVLFHDAEEARRAAHDLEERGIPQDDMRLYSGEEILEIESRFGEERSNVARVVEAMTADRDVKTRYVDNARAGGAALWLFAPRKDGRSVDASARRPRLLLHAVLRPRWRGGCRRA